MDVVVLRWPEEEERRASLAGAGLPRLLVIANGTSPPRPGDCLEDWVHLPAPEAELEARALAILARAGHHHKQRPELDDEGLLEFGNIRVALAPVEARITGALLARFGSVVSRPVLARAAWPDSARGRNALDVYVLRLRRRLGPAGLAIRTVRSRGYLLEAPTSSNGSST